MDGRTPESQSGTTSGGRVSADRPAVLVVRAPDRPGLVAAVAAALRDSGATIVDAPPGKLAAQLADAYLKVKATGRL